MIFDGIISSDVEGATVVLGPGAYALISVQLDFSAQNRQRFAVDIQSSWILRDGSRVIARLYTGQNRSSLTNGVDELRFNTAQSYASPTVAPVLLYGAIVSGLSAELTVDGDTGVPDVIFGNIRLTYIEVPG